MTDNTNTNNTISIKTTRKMYSSIFFETIKNTNTNEKGWGFYSKADYIFYTWTNYGVTHNLNEYRIISFKLSDILKLDLYKYNVGYGFTKLNGKVIYKTKGRLIPIEDFKFKILLSK